MKKHLVLHQKVLEIPLLKHENYPSVSKIKYNQNETLNFYFPPTKVEAINKIIKSLNLRKATGQGGIPVKTYPTIAF